MYDASHLRVCGELEAVIELQNKFIPATFIITEATKSHGLIGTDLIDMEKSSVMINFMKYEELGKVNSHKARIRMKEGCKPCYFEARTLPIHIKPLAVQELKEMEMAGIISKVEGGSEWEYHLLSSSENRMDQCACVEITKLVSILESVVTLIQYPMLRWR